MGASAPPPPVHIAAPSPVVMSGNAQEAIARQQRAEQKLAVVQAQCKAAEDAVAEVKKEKGIIRRTRSIEFDDTLLTQKTNPGRARKMSLQSRR